MPDDPNTSDELNPEEHADGGAKNAPPDESTSDGTFSQADIEEALNEAISAASGESKSTPEVSETPEPAAGGDEKLDSAGRPVDDATAAMAAEIAEEPAAASTGHSATGGDSATSGESMNLKSPDLPDFTGSGIPATTHDISILRDLDMRVHVELGRSKMFLEDVIKLGEGSVVELDRLAGDPVDVFVNDRLVARGEVLVLGDNFCVRVSDIVSDLQLVESS